MKGILEKLEALGAGGRYHGVLFFDRGMPSSPRHKQSCYDDGIRVPFIMTWTKNFPVAARG